MSLNRRLVLGIALGAFLSVPALAPAADEPAKLAGTWTWKWKDAKGETHRHVLEVEGTGDKIAARERFDDEAPVKVDSFKLDGKKVSFTVSGKAPRPSTRGPSPSDNAINGLVTIVPEGGQASEFGWTAAREAGGK